MSKREDGFGKDRRDFLQRILAGTAALATGGVGALLSSAKADAKDSPPRLKSIPSNEIIPESLKKYVIRAKRPPEFQKIVEDYVLVEWRDCSNKEDKTKWTPIRRKTEDGLYEQVNLKTDKPFLELMHEGVQNIQKNAPKELLNEIEKMPVPAGKDSVEAKKTWLYNYAVTVWRDFLKERISASEQEVPRLAEEQKKSMPQIVKKVEVKDVLAFCSADPQEVGKFYFSTMDEKRERLIGINAVNCRELDFAMSRAEAYEVRFAIESSSDPKIKEIVKNPILVCKNLSAIAPPSVNWLGFVKGGDGICCSLDDQLKPIIEQVKVDCAKRVVIGKIISVEDPLQGANVQPSETKKYVVKSSRLHDHEIIRTNANATTTTISDIKKEPELMELIKNAMNTTYGPVFK